ncbi:beta-ketoacyl-[acyl-carrier-protein] synthase family protein [Parafilimonas terrae]|uniref:3-oxoacyl-[acyl-carrier-protein] synthase-1 n=1 Tax=Parafilimonas terrae TaxID=1465490 RepID=A0A1I5Z7N2_9BACT|nr:beta-ketoacyl synthase N-terminal-like domain-containing protein [Parafilimonas terrae]SFQ52483.1 3-oxoacyl-[acyl-carrier-protein] synthase-1 [Parafilimonas terrae]
MKDVFIIADNIFSPLGSTTKENFDALLHDISAVKEHHNAFADEPYYAALFNNDFSLPASPEKNYTKFEKLIIASVDEALKQSGINVKDDKTLLIISTTKGNISLLESEVYDEQLQKKIALHTSAKLITAHFGFINQPLIISNACISGSLAIITGMRVIQSGKYDNVVVTGADIITKFILSGFKSFQALSNGLCKPFDADRNGINLGEAAATVVLSSNRKNADGIKVISGAVSNDANHISGPSRTGNELYQCIAAAMDDARLSKENIDFISAHGTATIYNDEMEAKAIALAGLTSQPVNSLKAFYGHTLGAAGLVESVISIESLQQNTILPTKGFEVHGVSQPINVCKQIIHKQINTCIKTASGFGGCNAAIIFSK